MRPWLVVLLKEVRENLRDRRAVAAALLMAPLLGPAVFAGMISFVGGKQKEEVSRILDLPVQGAEHAPNLIRLLKEQRINPVAAPQDAQAAVRAQEQELVLSISADFARSWRASSPARVDLIYDGSRQQSRVKVQRVRGVLEAYSRQTGQLRLLVRGIDGQLLSAVQVVDRDLSTAENKAAVMMAMLPYLLILGAFVGSMYLAIDVTSGERERQSLEPLLLTPVPRSQIMLGKQLAAALFALASQLITILAFSLSVRAIPVDVLGIELAISPRTGLTLALIVAPIALLAASSQVLMAGFAKTFREAQTYQSFLLIVPIIPSLVMVVNPMRPEPWMMAVPILGQSVQITEVVRGASLVWSDWALSTAATALLSLLLGILAARLFGREQQMLSS